VPEILGIADLPDGARGIERRLALCRAIMTRAAERAKRNPDGIRLVAVTKYVDDDVVRALLDAKVSDVAESRVQALESRSSLFRARPTVGVHLIGHLQRNKVRRALELVDAIHSLDSLRLLEALDERCSQEANVRVREIFVEVNVAEDDAKTGLSPLELDTLLGKARDSNSIRPRIRGLMGMGPTSGDPVGARTAFRRLRHLRDDAIERGLLPEGSGLSMGMSGDFEIAVEEGSTLVRIGSFLYQ
jgi:pyridoxal phosphate enzyme (YggS family)